MDYDIGVVGLASPQAQAVVTSYRPAVSVRNNGIHDAIASGYLRIYAAGLLVFETEVYSGTLAPGATGTADAIDYWTPPAEGTYIIQGYVSTPLDQVEPNNNLNPVTIIVAGSPVPPTPTVPLHAAQHEEGGTDPLNVDGLPGVLKDRQLPSAHAAQHQAGGSDALNIGGLAGVAGDPQTPVQHGNAHHTPDMATSAQLEAHSGSTAAHTAATNLANRETTGPLTGRVPQDQIQLGTAAQEDPEDDQAAMGLRIDRNMGYVNPAHHAYKHEPGGSDPLSISAASLGVNAALVEIVPLAGGTLVELEVPAAWLSAGMQFIVKLCGYIHTLTASGATLNLTLFLGEDNMGYLSIPIGVSSDRDFTIEAAIIGRSPDGASGVLSWLASGALPTDFEMAQANENTLFVRPTEDTTITITAELVNAHPDAFLESMTGYIRALHQPS